MLTEADPNERFRTRRRRARRRRTIRRVLVLAVLAVAAAAIGLGSRSFGEGDRGAVAAEPKRADDPGDAWRAKPEPTPTPLPREVRGVHVTMSLAALPGKLDEYLALREYGLNTLEVDVKDESGEVAFVRPRVPLARAVGAARRYYDPRRVARKAAARGVYLIGRVVVFEDPILAPARPEMAIRTPAGGVWTNDAGLAWSNPYDRRVWKYNVDVAEAAVEAGFEEIMFDYVRFPSDGDVEAAVFPGKTGVPKSVTIARFLRYARERLHPLGARVSAAVFGLSAARDVGIGQKTRRIAPHLDAIYPMVYPSHYGPGEYGLPDPNAAPGATVARSLRDFRRRLRGLEARLVPWLQDFSLGRTYTLEDVQAQVAAAHRARSAAFLLWNAAGVYNSDALRGK